MRARTGAILTGLVGVGMFFSAVLGANLVQQPDAQTPQDRAAVTTETSTITVEVPAPFIPQSCLQALELADELKVSAGRFDSAVTPQVDIMSQASKLIADRDQAGLNLLIQRQMEATGATLEAALHLSTGLTAYNKARKTCQEETQ